MGWAGVPWEGQLVSNLESVISRAGSGRSVEIVEMKIKGEGAVWAGEQMRERLVMRE